MSRNYAGVAEVSNSHAFAIASHAGRRLLYHAEATEKRDARLWAHVQALDIDAGEAERRAKSAPDLSTFAVNVPPRPRPATLATMRADVRRSTFRPPLRVTGEIDALDAVMDLAGELIETTAGMSRRHPPVMSASALPATIAEARAYLDSVNRDLTAYQTDMTRRRGDVQAIAGSVAGLAPPMIGEYNGIVETDCATRQLREPDELLMTSLLDWVNIADLAGAIIELN